MSNMFIPAKIPAIPTKVSMFYPVKFDEYIQIPFYNIVAIFRSSLSADTTNIKTLDGYVHTIPLHIDTAMQIYSDAFKYINF
jgi:hypothetical protein